MHDSVRWGIVGTGKIARKMADAIQFVPGCRLQAVGSRSIESATAFAREFEAPQAHRSYEALFADPLVDVVYIATPHPLHCENTLAALAAGKAVLCEKPFAMNAREAARMAGMAREKDLFLMEAMWTRFLPAIMDVKNRVDRGDIGELRMLSADFGFRSDYDPESRLFKPELGGGALLDVGIYPVSLAHHLLGQPSRIHAEAAFSPLNTDEQTAILLKYPGGQLATLTCAVRTTTVHEAILSGTEGTIRIQPDWWRGSQFLQINPTGTVEHVVPTTHPNGFVYEVEETLRCIREGSRESPVMPLDESIAIMQTMDAASAVSRT